MINNIVAAIPVLKKLPVTIVMTSAIADAFGDWNLLGGNGRSEGQRARFAG